MLQAGLSVRPTGLLRVDPAKIQTELAVDSLLDE